VGKHRDDLHGDIRLARSLGRDLSRDRRGQGLSGLPADLATEDDVDQSFLVSERDYVDRLPTELNPAIPPRIAATALRMLFSGSRCLRLTPHRPRIALQPMRSRHTTSSSSR
jgi:hypothetical protein